MDIQKLSGEQLAEILNQEYQKLMQSQTNIMVIQKELENRKKPVEKVEVPLASKE